MLVFPAINITDTENSGPQQRALSNDPHVPWRPERDKFVDLLGDGTVIVDPEFSQTRIPGNKRRAKMHVSRVYLEPVHGDDPTENGILYEVHRDHTPTSDPDQRSPLTRLLAISPGIEHTMSPLWGTVRTIRLSKDQLLWLRMVL